MVGIQGDNWERNRGKLENNKNKGLGESDGAFRYTFACEEVSSVSLKCIESILPEFFKPRVHSRFGC